MVCHLCHTASQALSIFSAPAPSNKINQLRQAQKNNAFWPKKVLDNIILIDYYGAMLRHIVKIERSLRQVRVTIPKALADQAELRGKSYCEIRINAENTIEIKKLELKKHKKAHLQESPVKAD